MVDKNSNAETQTHDQTIPTLSKYHRVRLVTALSIFLFSFALYLFTLAPTVTLVDSGELILAARTLGVPHPPGFPLYIVIAHLFSLLPIGNIATRIHLVSALFAALASTVLLLAVIEALQIKNQSISKAKPAPKKRAKSTTKEADSYTEPAANPIAIFVPAILAGLLFAFSRTLWAYATIAEVYTLNAFLMVTIIWLMMRWRRGAIEAKATRTPVRDRNLYLAALVFGLALGVHHVTIGLLLPALATLVLATEGLAFFKSKRFLIAALVSLAGLTVYIYLPIAASRSPLMNWGSPNTLEQFWWHITGKQYQVFFELSLSRISEFFTLVFREFSPPWLPLTLLVSGAGFYHLFKSDKPTFYFLLLILIADLLYCLGYEIAEDKDAYYLPAFIAIIIAFGFGIRWLLLMLSTTGFKDILTPIRAAFIFFLLPLIALGSNYQFNNRKPYFIAHDYVENIFKTLEPNALLLTNDWQVYAPTLFARELEQQRRDVVVIDVNQLRRWWYFDYLKQSFPDLIHNSRDKVDAFLEDLINWEHHPELYARDANLNKRINGRFYEMIFSFISTHIQNAPVYITQDIALRQGGQDAELTQGLNEKYKFVPQGLVFRVSKEASLPDNTKPQLNTRGLADGTLHFEEDDVVKKKVYPVYVSMFINNGRYWAVQNRHDRAIEWYKDALALEPNNQAAKNFLAASQNAQQKPETSK